MINYKKVQESFCTFLLVRLALICMDYALCEGGCNMEPCRHRCSHGHFDE